MSARGCRDGSFNNARDIPEETGETVREEA